MEVTTRVPKYGDLVDNSPSPRKSKPIIIQDPSIYPLVRVATFPPPYRSFLFLMGY